MPDIPKLIVKTFPKSENFMKFCTTITISNSGKNGFCHPLDIDEDRIGIEKLGPIGRNLVPRIVAIHGVHLVEINTYDLLIKKGQSFTWKELVPQIYELLITFAFRPAPGSRICIVQDICTTMDYSDEDSGSDGYAEDMVHDYNEGEGDNSDED